MGVITTVLTVEGGSEVGYTLSRCKYSFNQEVDDSGTPTSALKGGVIEIETTTVADTDNFLAGWMRDPSGKKSGEIEYTDATGQAYLKIKFQDGICINYEGEYVYYDTVGNNDYLRVKIASPTISVGSVDFEL